MNKKGIFITTLLAIVGGILALVMILNMDTFLWDEAHHVYFGNQIYLDLIRLDIKGFFAHTGNQAWFQPLHSYLNGLFFLVLGRSYLAARLSSLFMYLLLFYIIYKYSQILSKEKHCLISSVANFLMATSPGMLMFAALNMQEMIGAVVILLSLIYYVTIFDKNEPKDYLILGVILSLVLLVKYHYGFLLGASVFLLEASRIFDIKEKSASIRRFITNNLLMLAGFVPITALWFLTPPVQRKVGLFLYRFQDVQSGYKEYNAIDRALYYVKSIISNFTFSFWIGLFILCAVIYCFKYFKDMRFRVLLTTVFVFFVFHSAISLVFNRLFVPVMPVMFILAGYSVSDIYHKYIKDRGKLLLISLSLVISILIAGDLIAATPLMNEFTFNRDLNQLSSKMFFGFIRRPKYLFPWNPGMELSPVFTHKPKTKFRDILDYCSNKIPKDKSISTLVSLLEVSPYEWYWHFRDWKAKVFTTNDYPIQGKYFWFSEYVIEFNIKETSPYIVEMKDGGKSWRESSEFLKQRGWLTLYASKDFDDIGIVVNIFKMKLPF